MSIKTSDAETSLTAKGFRQAPKRDHHYYFLWLDGKKTAIHAKVSHGAREIDDYILSKIRRSLRLQTNSQAADLLQCPMSQASYLKILRDNMHL